MSEKRLQELLKQKALLEEHLAWLESEINAEHCLQVPENAPAAAPKNRLSLDISETMDDAPLTEAFSDDEPDPMSVVSDVYDQLGPDTRASVSETRRGCVTAFAIACAALAGLLIWIYATY